MMFIASSRLDSFMQFVGSLLIFIVVLAITYLVTRWIGNYQKVQMKNQNMQVIETMRINNNKFIQIVKVAEEFLVISVTKERIELLTKLDEKSVEQIQMPDDNKQDSFQEILKKLRKNRK